MKIKNIPVNIPVLDGNEKKYLSECIETGWISSEGPFVRRFEKEFADYIGCKYAVAVTNGTTAIDLAIESLKLKIGDEILLPALTIISCLNQILRAGLKPVFVDSNIDDFNINIEDLKSKITKKTKAILVVHLYGLPVKIDAIMEIAAQHNLEVIEDTAEQIGQTYKNAMCGSFGTLSTFSFYPNKHITTGEGGMILTNREDLYNRLCSLRNLGFQKEPEKRFIHHDLGWNARMTNIQAALGVAQLETISRKIEKKKAIGNFYLSRIKNEKFSLPLKSNNNCENIFWVFTLVAKEGLAISYMKKLKEKGIETRPFFYPLDRQPVLEIFNVRPTQLCNNANQLYEKGFYLPSGLNLTEKEIQYISDCVNEL